MDYRKLQLQEIRKHNVYVIPNSKCWSRTHAHCDGTRTVCKHFLVNSYGSLFTLLHEIGHIETDVKGMKRCEQETEATLWAINRIKELGLPVKRKVVNSYKRYIRMTYDRGIRRGLSKKIKSKMYM